MYCENCGKELGFNDEVCSKCGSRVDSGTIFIQQQRGVPESSIIYNIPAKNAGHAAVFSFFIAGLGQMYAGKIGRGLLIMFGYVALALLSGGIFTVSFLDNGTLNDINFSDYSGRIILLIICAIGMIALWVWNLFDAYKLANQYNDALVSDKKRPW
jgi:TM2 domain-containing membrane protein YozV